jgi:hypothetical protein
MNSNWAPLFVALLFLTTQIAAQEQAVLGQGNVSCGSWLNDRKGDDAQASSKIACGISQNILNGTGLRIGVS